MMDPERYRHYAAECLLAAKKACDPHYGRLAVSMAALWLKLAKQDEAVMRLLTSWQATDGERAADRN